MFLRALAVWILSTSAVGGQVVQRPFNYLTPKDVMQDDRQLSFLRIGGHSRDYELGPGDVVEIKIVGLTGFDQVERVSNSGRIVLPMLGEILAGGMTAGELENTVAARLEKEKLIKAPEVLVYITEYRAKPVFVLGEVDRPGQYIMTQQLSVVDAILLAGGLDFTAARFGYLHRRPSDSRSLGLGQSDENGTPKTQSEAEVTKIDLQPLKEGGIIQPNIVMRRGDVLFVPKRKVDVYYVVGDVGRAGAFEIPQEQDLLVSRAISWAGGPTKTAKMSQGILVRYNENGQREELQVDFDAVLKGRRPDFSIRPDDIIFIPGSSAKSLGYGLLGIVPSLARSAFLYGLVL